MKSVENFKKIIDQITIEIGNSKLVAVSKYHPLEDIIMAYDAGLRDFGESRTSDLLEKASELANKEISWHFVGHLQTNKVNQLLKVPNLKYLHSVDSLKLLKELYKKQDNLVSDNLKFMLQLNTSDESEKSGFSFDDDFFNAVDFIKQQNSSKLEFIGLMTIGKIRTDDFEKDAELCFAKMLEYRELLSTKYNLSSLKLSMGMSSDYKTALKFQTDFIRLGSKIFGS